ncbi:MAG: hypothetical protein IPL39_15110 [Opitutaceae bacterium]|nr:hypothetical protein [Opitutaceae bacterium]
MPQQPRPRRRVPDAPPDAAAHYMESIHGKALRQGLAVAPSCNDCHGVHDIRRSVDKASHTNHLNIAKTCGQCHVGVEEVYKTSIHGQLLAAGDKRGPVCSDCHTAHDIENPVSAHFKAGSDQSCGKCHQDRLAHYRDTYHGKAMALGSPTARRMWRRASTATATTTCSPSATRARASPPAGSSPPASNATPAWAQASPNTSRTPTRSTAPTTPFSTRSSSS